MAALFYEDCRTDFKGVNVTEAVEKYMTDFMKRAGK